MPTISMFYGIEGHVRFLPTCLIGVFTSLKNPDFFKKVFIEDGAVIPNFKNNDTKVEKYDILKFKNKNGRRRCRDKQKQLVKN